MRQNIYEFLKSVNDAKSKAERIRMLQAYPTRPVKNILAMAFDKNIEFDLPEGAPPFKRDTNEPVGMSSTDLFNEGKRLARCLKSDPIPALRKEAMFIQILEGLHYTEADLVVAAKDKNLASLFPNIDRETVRKAFPTLLTDMKPNQYTKDQERFQKDD
jgi:hypothetical protein